MARKSSRNKYDPLIYGVRPAPSIPTHITVALGIDSTKWSGEEMWVPVMSSNVQSIMYKLLESELYVQFSSGRMYRYSNVPRSVAELMFNVNSAGAFVHRVLKNRYPVIEMTTQF